MEKFLNSRLISDMINSPNEYWKKKRETNIITIYANQTVGEAIELMSTNKILSMPVLEQDKKDFLGFIDMNDILYSIIKYYTDLYPEAELTDTYQWAHWCRDINELTKRGKEFDSQPVSNLINQSKIDEFIPVDESGTLFQLIEEVFSKGIHRVLVYDVDAKVKGFISQTDILKYLLENLDEIGQEIEQPVGTLGLINDNVISMSSQALAIHAYYLMLFNRVPCVAINNPNGEIVGNLSVTDLRGFGPKSFSSLLEPALDFWDKHSKKKLMLCTRDTQLKVVMMTLFEHRIHRLWVVNGDQQKKCNGIISLTDIMRLLSKIGMPKTPRLSASISTPPWTKRIQMGQQNLSKLN
eukprot:gene7716-9490_t